MTYSVPYSFVPGTKAKADEVNANFIDILNKIEETNIRIDEANDSLSNTNQELVGKIEAVNKSKADLSLSNINSTAKGLFDKKANSSDIDGSWTNKTATIVTAGTSFTKGETKSFSLSSYLPSDKNIYEVIFSGSLLVNGYSMFFARTDKLTATNHVVFRAQGNPQYDANSFIMPVGTGRMFYLQSNTSQTSTNQLHVLVHGYRKVR